MVPLLLQRSVEHELWDIQLLARADPAIDVVVQDACNPFAHFGIAASRHEAATVNTTPAKRSGGAPELLPPETPRATPSP